MFTLALRSLERHVKRGTTFLVSKISGGMVCPAMMRAGAVPRSHLNLQTSIVVTNRNARVAMVIPMMGYLLSLLFPGFVNFFK